MSENISRSETPVAPTKWLLGLIVSLAVLLATLPHLGPSLGQRSALWSVSVGLGVGGYAVWRSQRSCAWVRQEQQRWADVTTASRVWTLQIRVFVPVESAAAAAARGAAFPRQQQLLYRHVAWVRVLGLPPESSSAQRQAAMLPFLEAAELEWIRGNSELLQLLLNQQAAALHWLHQGGGLPEPQLAALLDTLWRLEQLHLTCETTPKPKRGWWELTGLKKLLFPVTSRSLNQQSPFARPTACAIEAEILALMGRD